MPTIEARLHLHPRRALDLMREERRLRRAAKKMPRPMPWDWARPRLMPLLAGPHLGPDPLVTVVGRPGCAIIFGIEIDGTYVLVDRAVAERWEVSEPQLAEAGDANLERRAARMDAAALQHGTLSGRIVRVLEAVPWASSLILSPAHLMRIFGTQDQLFATPKRGTLMSFSLDTPGPVVAHVVIDYEANAAWPLLLDPFLLTDGRIVWQEPTELEDWSAND